MKNAQPQTAGGPKSSMDMDELCEVKDISLQQSRSTWGNREAVKWKSFKTIAAVYEHLKKVTGFYNLGECYSPCCRGHSRSSAGTSTLFAPSVRYPRCVVFCLKRWSRCAKSGWNSVATWRSS